MENNTFKSKIAIAQINSIPADVNYNKNKIIEYIKKAIDNEAGLVLFPECIIYGHHSDSMIRKFSFIQDQIKNAIQEICDLKLDIDILLGYPEFEKDNLKILKLIENEKEYLAAKKAVEEILSGSETLEEDLFAMANELKDFVEKEQRDLADIISELQEQSAHLEEEKAELEAEEKRLAVKLEVLGNSTKKLEAQRGQLQEEIHELSRKENVLFFSDMKGQCEKAQKECASLEKQLNQTKLRLEQCGKELYGTEVQSRSCQKEERRITSELEAFK